MSDKIIIDTKYAKRDLKRIASAIEELEKAKRDYIKLIDSLNSSYKGNASEHLQEIIRSVKIKKIDNQIKKLNNAYIQLNQTIKKSEDYNNKLVNSMKG